MSEITNDLAQNVISALLGFWERAVAPLKSMGYETLLLFLFLLLLIALVITWVLRISWMFSQPVLAKRSIKRVGHAYKDYLRLSAADSRAVLKVGDGLAEQALADLALQKLNRYHVVTIVEAKTKRVCLYREIKIQLGRRKGIVKGDSIQLDASDLSHLRMNNGHPDDDDPESEILGLYDVYIRPVRWWDVRHWLTHPNREIRIVVWVTLITTGLPVVFDIFFR